jgi:hypothetical protein
VINCAYGDVRFLVFLDDFEWEQFDVGLYGGVLPLPPDESLGVKDSVLGVGGELVLGSVADKALPLRCEGHVTRRDPVALVVRDYLHTTVLKHADAVM